MKTIHHYKIKSNIKHVYFIEKKFPPHMGNNNFWHQHFIEKQEKKTFRGKLLNKL